MPISSHKLAAGSVTPSKLSADLRRGSYVNVVADAQPACGNGTGDGAPAGTAGATNCARWRGGLFTTYHLKGAGAQTILGPRHSAGNGVDLVLDMANDTGAEHVIGSLAADSEFATVIGTDPDPFIRLKLKVTNVAGTDDLCVGFREVEAFAANVDDYTDAFWINVNVGGLIAEGIVNNAATVSTAIAGAAWANGSTHTLEVRLAGRQALAFNDGVPLTFPSYQFTAGLVVVPFVYILQTAVTCHVYVTEIACGPARAESS